MKFSKADIEEFMELGKPRGEKFLRWHGRESFFDDGVQQVMMRLHPDNWKQVDDDLKGFPIDAWSIADSIALCPSEREWSRLFPYMEKFPLWTAELLTAIMHYKAAQAHEKRDTALGELIAWRNDLYLSETSRLNYSHEEVVKVNTLLKKPLELEKVPAKLRGWLKGIPAGIRVRENPAPPRKWMEGTKRTVSPEAYRVAAHTENNRRDEIMRRWAESWIGYMAGTGVSKTTPKK